MEKREREKERKSISKKSKIMNGKQDCYLLFGNSITKGTQKTSKIIKINKKKKKSIKPKGACEEMEGRKLKEWKLFWSKKNQRENLKRFSAEKQFIMSQK